MTSSSRQLSGIGSLNFFPLLPALPLLVVACTGGEGSQGDCQELACAEADGGLSDSDGGPGAPDAALPSKRALIEIELEPPAFQGGSPRTYMHGGFVDQVDPNCTPQIVGSCVVTDCTQQDFNSYAAPGKLTFSPAFNGIIGFDPGPFRIFFSVDAVPWAADEQITISSAGEGVPAFSMKVASPRTLDVGEDREFFNLPLVKSQPLKATWIPISEQVLLRLRQGRDTPNGEYEVIAECLVGGAFGNGDIPAAALSRFILDSNGGLGARLETFAVREATVIAGDFVVKARVLRSFGLGISYDVL